MTLCNLIGVLTTSYLDDELDAPERQELEVHLHDCPACRAYFDRERASVARVRARLAPPRAPSSLRARLDGELDADDAARRQWIFVVAAFAFAALAVIVFVVATCSGCSPPRGYA